MLFSLTIGLSEEEKHNMTDIYYNYRKLMKFTALRYVNDNQIAEDIVQEAFFKIRKNLSKINQFKCNERPSCYVSIVKSISKDYLRKQKREANNNLLAYQELKEYGSDSVEEDVINAIKVHRMMQVIHNLDSKYREVLLARYYYGYSVKETCERMNIESENTVRSLCSRARKQCVKLLKESGA